VIKSREHLSSL
jgi:succinate dehydrogenase cytochrome b556 subunit